MLLPALLGCLTAFAAALGVLVLAEEPSARWWWRWPPAGYLALLLPCSWVWFRRTDQALNTYWPRVAATA